MLNSCHLCASIRWSPQPNAPSAPSSSRLWRVCFPKKEQRWNTVIAHMKTVLPCAAHRHLKAIRPQLRVITVSFLFCFFKTLLLFYRKQWSSCWKRYAIFCRPPTATSVRLWSTRSAGQCWMQSWLMRPRRPSVTSCTSVKGKNPRLWVSLFSLAFIAVIVIVYLICHMLDTRSPETRMSNNLSCTCFIFKKFKCRPNMA